MTTREVEANPLAIVASPRVAVEASLPRGARVVYGLVGIAFEPSANDRVLVEVPVCTAGGASWPESLAAAVDDVRVGLLDEYALAIRDAAARALTTRCPSGDVRVVEGAYGAVGSSSGFFRCLTVCAVRLLLEVPDVEHASLDMVVEECLLR